MAESTLGWSMKLEVTPPPAKIVAERHEDGYVAYPVGLRGVVVAQGDTLDEALTDLRSAIRFHLDTFGEHALEDEPIDVVLADLTIPA